MSKKAESKTELIHGLPPIWNMKTVHVSGDDTDGITGISPIPVLLVIGDTYTGKSTTAANVDPAMPGEKTRTLVLDTEDSWATLKQQFSVDWIDLRKMASDEYGKDYKQIHLFLSMQKALADVKPGQYTNLVLDKFSDLATGAHQWVVKNPGYFEKADGAFRGKDGTIFAWGDVDVWFKQYLMNLAQIFQTITLCSEEKDVYSENKVTGNKAIRGRDMTPLATVSLWLAKDPANNKRWAIVKKSRLSSPIWFDAEGNRLRRPIMADTLPALLRPKFQGQTYPELILDYMDAPLPSYGDLDSVEGFDPSKHVMTDDERRAQQIEADEKKLQMMIHERKLQIINNLKGLGLYASPAEIAQTIIELELSEDAQVLTKLDEVEAKLIAHRQPVMEVSDAGQVAEPVN